MQSRTRARAHLLISVEQLILFFLGLYVLRASGAGMIMCDALFIARANRTNFHFSRAMNRASAAPSKHTGSHNS